MQTSCYIDYWIFKLTACYRDLMNEVCNNLTGTRNDDILQSRRSTDWRSCYSLFPVSLCLLTDHPDAVQEFNVRTQSPRSVTLEWKPPRRPGLYRYKVSANYQQVLNHTSYLSHECIWFSCFCKLCDKYTYICSFDKLCYIIIIMCVCIST